MGSRDSFYGLGRLYRGEPGRAVPDKCAACGRPGHFPCKDWENKKSVEGQVICANYCGDSCWLWALENPIKVVDFLNDLKRGRRRRA